jgi:[acyl-carrier-protein] S-malonyltransferase
VFDVAHTAFLLAGQGAYRPGVFAGDQADAGIAEVLAVVDSVAAEFGHPGIRALLLDPAAPTGSELAATDSFALQLALFATAVGEYRKASRRATPDVLVGHSLGELAALTSAGGFDLADGARLICHRSRALEHSGHPTGGMVALELSARRTAHLVGAIGDRRLVVAISNAPNATVVAGPDSALDDLCRAAKTLEVRATRLPAPYPYHSPGLAPAAMEFAESAAAIRQRPLRLPVYSPLLGDYLTDTEDFLALLVRHLSTPVDFLSAVRTLHVDGLRVIVECGRSGRAKLVHASVPGVVSGEEHETEAAPAVAVPATVSVPVSVVDQSDVVSRLRELYASSLGYPVEALDADADLEADLGVDSLKRAEMLGKVGIHFGLPESVNDGRFLAHGTLGELADMITATLTPVGAAR